MPHSSVSIANDSGSGVSRRQRRFSRTKIVRPRAKLKKLSRTSKQRRISARSKKNNVALRAASWLSYLHIEEEREYVSKYTICGWVDGPRYRAELRANARSNAMPKSVR